MVLCKQMRKSKEYQNQVLNVSHCERNMSYHGCITMANALLKTCGNLMAFSIKSSERKKRLANPYEMFPFG